MFRFFSHFSKPELRWKGIPRRGAYPRGFTKTGCYSEGPSDCCGSSCLGHLYNNTAISSSPGPCPFCLNSNVALFLISVNPYGLGAGWAVVSHQEPSLAPFQNPSPWGVETSPEAGRTRFPTQHSGVRTSLALPWPSQPASGGCR